MKKRKERKERTNERKKERRMEEKERPSFSFCPSFHPFFRFFLLSSFHFFVRRDYVKLLQATLAQG